MITQRSMILAKVESTYGTDPTPTTSADAIQVFDIDLEVMRESLKREAHDVTMSPLTEVMGDGLAKLKFSCHLKGSGTAGTAPDWVVLANACGFYNTNVAVTSDTLKPDDTPTTSCTIWVYKDGIKYALTGCRGEMKLSLESGKIGILQFEFQGKYALPTDVTFPASVTLDSTKPVPVLGATFTFGSYAAIANKLELALNNEIVKNTSFNQAYGVESFEITKRDPSGSMTVNAVLRATSNADFWSYMENGTTKALSIVIGGTAGNIATITAPICVVRTIKNGNQGGIATWEVEFQLARSSGGDELVIALT